MSSGGSLNTVARTPTAEVAPRNGVRDGAPEPPVTDDQLSPAEVWPKVKQLAGPRLSAMLETMAMQEATDRLLTLAVPKARAAMARDHLPEIVRLVQQAGARSMSISLVEAKPALVDTPDDPQTPLARPAQDNSEQAEHPLVQEAARVFGAKVVHIQPKR